MTYLECAKLYLTPPVYERYKKNCESPNDQYDNDPSTCFRWLSRYSVFDWRYSPEGFDYWCNIMLTLENRGGL